MGLSVKAKSNTRIATRPPDFLIQSSRVPVVWFGFPSPLWWRWCRQWKYSEVSPEMQGRRQRLAWLPEPWVSIFIRHHPPIGWGASPHPHTECISDVGEWGLSRARWPWEHETQLFVSCHCFQACVAHTYYFSTILNLVTLYRGLQARAWTPRLVS